ncbi:thioredoxin domain-containing protein [Leucobacter sp. wl10]|uniref:DsbA family protein n=1 Tax=Leucobacter sp. wl10 TaxID=2304677 RepID=UPI000E5B9757|nr:thioredoxin domain-containing protein [Leucobacter sp. wl10]RGE19275.1 hypothetical protein D1J51_12145 [Leucobacter sp. wl10]
MPDQKIPKKQRLAAARERVRLEQERERRRAKRRQVLIRAVATVGALALLAGVGGIVWASTRPPAPGPANMLSGGVVFTGGGGKTSVVKTAGMPAGSDAVPTDPKKSSAPARIVTYIDFSCEYCKAFEGANAQQIEKMVAQGEATLEVQPVAILGDYSLRAASAASCMAALQPESFFDMLAAMYENQPTEGGPGMTNSQILDVWAGAGIDPSPQLASCVRSGQYTDWIQARTQSVATDPKTVNPATGSFGTPTVFVNDVRYEPQNLNDPKEFAAFVAANRTDSKKSTPTPSS